MEASVIVSRVFNARIESMWKLWTDPELVKQWWGPDLFNCPMARIDFREGGVSLVCMQAPKEFGGATTYSIWTYTKIIPHERIEFTQSLADKNGVTQDPTTLGMPPDFPHAVPTIVTFKAISNEQTEMTVTEYADFGQTRRFAQMGMEQCFGKMERILQAT